MRKSFNYIIPIALIVVIIILFLNTFEYNTTYLHNRYCYDRINDKVYNAARVNELESINNLDDYYNIYFQTQPEYKSLKWGYINIQEVKVIEYVNDSIAKVVYISAGSGRLATETIGYVFTKSLHKNPPK